MFEWTRTGSVAGQFGQSCSQLPSLRLVLLQETGILDPSKFVAVTSTNAAKVFNIYPKKGRIAVGSDADIVIWNPQAMRTISKDAHHSNVDFNIFEGLRCRGVAETVITGGRVVLEDGELRVTQGAGRFVPTPPNCQYLYGRVEARDKVRAPVEPSSRVAIDFYSSACSECCLQGYLFLFATVHLFV